MPLGRATGYLTRPLAALALAGLVAAAASQGAVRAQARPPVTFNRDVAPILYANCTTCHRPGESGPFSLLTYEDAKQRAGLISAVTTSHVMPPWQPESEEGEFEGERRLEPREIDTFRRWVEDGLQEGSAGGSSRCSDLYRWLAARCSGRRRQHARPVRRSSRRPRRLSKLRAAHSVERATVCARPRVPAWQCARPSPRAILLDDSGEIRRLDAAETGARVRRDGRSWRAVSRRTLPRLGARQGAGAGGLSVAARTRQRFRRSDASQADAVVPKRFRRRSVCISPIRRPRRTPVMLRLGSKTIDIPAGEDHYEDHRSVHAARRRTRAERLSACALPGPGNASWRDDAEWQTDDAAADSELELQLAGRISPTPSRWRFRAGPSSRCTIDTTTRPTIRTTLELAAAPGSFSDPRRPDEMGELLVQVLTQ